MTAITAIGWHEFANYLRKPSLGPLWRTPALVAIGWLPTGNFPGAGAGVYPRVRTGKCERSDRWVRRRVRQCYGKQWKRPGTRRRMPLRLGASRAEVHLASRSRKGCWRMSTNSIVPKALTNAWLTERGVPNLPVSWIAYHHPPRTTESVAR